MIAATAARRQVLAIIPARGGSKGIPRKNLRLMAGKPMLAHSIGHALGTPAVTRVIVSTDDAEIAASARAFGAEVVWRPAEISGDRSSSEAALLHVLDALRDRERYEPDLIVFLQATSPLRRPGEIQEALDTMDRERADSLFSACPTHGFVWSLRGDDLASVTYDYRARQMRQDGPEFCVENGSIYAFKPWVLREHNNRLGGVIAMHRMALLDSFQVDEPEDLELIDALMAARSPRPRKPDMKGIRLIVLDFDGVLTDNLVTVGQDSRESVACHRGDGWGIARAREAGLDVVVLSTETNPVVAARCRKLGIASVQGCVRKVEALEGLARDRAIRVEQIAFVGNDVNDLECLLRVGLPIAVADAEPEVLAVAHLVTRRSGGRGAVREVMDWAVAARSAETSSLVDSSTQPISCIEATS